MGFFRFIVAAVILATTAHGFAPTPTTMMSRSGSGVVLHRPTGHDILSLPSSLNMFTGIVEEMGEVLSLTTKSDMTLWDGSQGLGTEMVIKGNVVLDGAYLGCSISVNGVCLTATELNFEENTFKVGLAPETLRKTNLGNYDSTTSTSIKTIPTVVNLERASEIGGRNSGHFVQGHVDDVGTIIDRWIDGNSLFFRVSFPYEYMRYIVPKGFIAIDGTSLTVCDVMSSEGGGAENNWFTFMLVEYTQKKIIIPMKEVGDTVNIEVDVLGKYSERAWETFVPKMEALETKVKELERKILQLENGGAVDNDSTRTQQQSGSINNSDDRRSQPTNTPEKWIREGQEFLHAKDMNPKRDNRNTKGTDWVRTEQEFYDTNY